MMFDLLCHSGDLVSLGGLDVLGSIGLVLHLLFYVALIAGPVLLAVLALGTARLRVAPAPYGPGQQTAREGLQAQYARGEITREQYERRKQDLG